MVLRLFRGASSSSFSSSSSSSASGTTAYSLGFLLLGLITLWQLLTWTAAPALSPRIAIVVLGGGLTAEGTLPVWTKLRCDKAAELYLSQSLESRSVDIITLSGGTTHKPNPVDKSGFPIGEAQAAAAYIIKHGAVPPNHVSEENFSLDTLGNAYFLRTMHLEPGLFTKIIVITNKWHMARTRVMFSHILSLPRRVGGQNALRRRKFDLSFVEVDDGLPNETILRARREREASSLAAYEEKTSKLFASMRELHDFIFEKHLAYASKRGLIERTPIDPEVLKTY